MNRMVMALAVPVLAIVMVAITLSGPPEPLPAVFLPEDCRRIGVVDRRDRPLVGIEDLEILPSGEVIFTAYNRRYRERPARGIYRISIEEMVYGEPPFAEEIGGIERSVERLYPHGMSIDLQTGRLAFVNRREPDDAEVVWGTLRPNGFDMEGRWSGGGSCRANDVLWRGNDLFVTLDRESCGFSIGDLIPGAATGKLLRVGYGGAETVAEGLEFPNGLVVLDNKLYVAETRGGTLRDMVDGEIIELPGGPDNITRGPVGTIVVAMHPDLTDYWLYTLDFTEGSGTRIMRLDPRRADDRTILFDDPIGKTFKGGTVAAFSRGTMIAGSAYDEGMLMCSQIFQNLPPRPGQENNTG
ncbi:MAG: hypothetical protein AAF899_18895 [Pseudomonadota bacterium]